ncbi:MAG: GAF domain-containing protein [Candidatus Sulfotelmatobacter sp.]
MRQMMHAPAFASFDGVTGGMILDLSEEGLSMQVGTKLERDRRVRLKLDLSEPAEELETTGYIAWADALGRAGVRFSELPVEARRRLNEWLAANAGAPSRMAPKLKVRSLRRVEFGEMAGSIDNDSMAIGVEAGAANGGESATSATMQYEFSSLGTDLTAALRMIGERARTLTRGTSAAIALVHRDKVICRASIGENAPALGTRLDVNSGLAGECFREARTVRCDDAEIDPRVDVESCCRLGIRSIVAAPVRYERDTVGVLMVLANAAFNFDEGDVAVVESLAHTVIVSIREAEMRKSG